MFFFATQTGENQGVGDKQQQRGGAEPGKPRVPFLTAMSACISNLQTA